MRKLPMLFILLCWITAAAAQKLKNPGAKSARQSILNFIDPTIDNVGQLLEPTRLTVHLVNQMIRFTPQRKDHLDDQISSFPLYVVSHRIGQVFAIKPVIEPVSMASWQEKMTWDHELEINKPWYYFTYLIDDEITVEFTAGKKSRLFPFSGTVLELEMGPKPNKSWGTSPNTALAK